MPGQAHRTVEDQLCWQTEREARMQMLLEQLSQSGA